MNAEEFNLREQELLRNIPEEFHPALSYYAYEKSHAYGYEEVANTLSGLVEALRQPIADYTKRIAK